jgi:AbrB family looped-hinge helix DNA binding protein
MAELRERVEVDSFGRITIPKKIRQQLQLKNGSILEAYPVKDNKIVLEVLIR